MPWVKKNTPGGSWVPKKTDRSTLGVGGETVGDVSPTQGMAPADIVGTGRGVLDALSMGWGGELESMLTGKPISEIEQAQKEFAKRTHGAGAIATLPAHLLTSLGGTKLVGSALKKAPALVQSLGQFLYGTGEGAMTGAGYADEGKKGSGALLGGALGAGGEAAVNILAQPARVAVNKLRGVDRVKDLAENTLVRRMGADPMRRLGMRGGAQIDATLAEVMGKKGTQLTSDVVKTGGDVPYNLAEAFEVASRGQGARNTRRQIQNITDQSPAQIIEELADNKMMAKAETNMLYNKANDTTTVVTKDLADILNHKASRGVDDGARNFFDVSEPPGSMREYKTPYTNDLVKVGDVVDTKSVDTLAKQLGNEAGVVSEKRNFALSKSLKKRSSELSDALKDANPLVKKARERASRQFKAEEAVELGRETFKPSMTVEKFNAALGKINHQDRVAVQQGALLSLEDLIQKNTQGTATALKHSGTEEKLSSLWTELQAKQMVKTGDDIKERATTMAKINRGMEGAAQGGLEDIKKTVEIPLAYSVNSAQFALITGGIRKLLSKKTSTGTIDLMAKKLLTKGGAKESMEELIKRGASRKATEKFAQDLRRMLAAGAGSSKIQVEDE